MKKKEHMYKAALISAIGLCAITPTAFASDGTINFEGQIVAQTCMVGIDGQSSTATVQLPPVAISALKLGSAQQTNFKIGLTGCEGAPKSAYAYFESGAGVDVDSGNLINTASGANAAQGVQLQIVDGQTNAPIQAGNSNQIGGTSKIEVDGDTAQLPYGVRYFAPVAADVKEGLLTGTVTFSVAYE